MEPEEGPCEPHGQVPEHVTLGFPRYFPCVHALQLEVPSPEKPSLQKHAPWFVLPAGEVARMGQATHPVAPVAF